LETDLPLKERIAQVIEFLLDYVPTFLEKLIVEPIWPWGFISGKVLDYIVNFLLGEGQLKGV
jgi:hypothetical protein